MVERHTYKVCRVLPRDPEQKMGRPPREVLMAWEDLSDAEVEQLRKLQEPRLKPGQIAELDGKIVARGPEVFEGPEAPDVEASEPEVEDDQGAPDEPDDQEDADAAVMRADDPVVVTRHATRMLWDVYRRHAAASAELREQANELNRRAIEQTRQLDEALSKARQPSPPINVDFEGVTELLRVGAGVIRDLMYGPPPRDGE